MLPPVFMSNARNPLDADTLRSFDLGNGKQGRLYSLPALEAAGIGPISKLLDRHSVQMQMAKV